MAIHTWYYDLSGSFVVDWPHATTKGVTHTSTPVSKIDEGFYNARIETRADITYLV